MLRIDLAKTKPGMELALPVHNPKVPARTLLKVGFKLTADIIDKLIATGVRTVWVRYPSLDFLQRFLNPEAIESQQEVLNSIGDTFGHLQRHAAAKLDYDAYTQSVGRLVDHILAHPAAGVFLGDLLEAPDELMRHSSTVTYLSILMGLKLDSYIVKERKHVDPARAKDVTNLGLGAMLHDIGITQLPAEVRERYRRSSDETDPAWREHPALGFHLVRGKIEPSAASVVLNHHQRFDGSGYAGKDYPAQDGRSIHIYARIAAAAELFDRIRNPPNLPKQATVFVLGAMLSRGVMRKFDPRVLRALLEVVPPYPPGSIVTLSDGRFAVCIDHNVEAPCRPIVQVIPDPADLKGGEELPAGPTIDLSQQTSRLFVSEIDGVDVSDLNFDTPRLTTREPAMATAGAW